MPHPQIEFLLNHAASATPFTSPSGQAFASIPLGAFSHQIASIHSPAFRDWLIAAFFREHNLPPTPYALRQTISTLAARAHCDGPRLHVARRVASHDNKIRIDLANPAGEHIEITAEGWQISSDTDDAAFLNTRGTAELPAPKANKIALFPNLPAPDQLRLTAWLLQALRPASPHPILVIEGPPASGKSTLARMLRALIDPSAAPLHTLPYTESELLALAYRNWILAFDHTGAVSPRISATLCRLATGAAIHLREPGDRRDPAPVELHRPIIVTTTDDWNPDDSLAARSLTIRLAPLTDDTRRTESDLWNDFDNNRAALLATLCDATARALKAITATRLTSTPRHADTAHWMTAAYPKQAAQIADALNQQPPSPILDAIEQLLKTHPTWTGTVTDLLHEIPVSAVTASTLSHHLRTHKNHLAARHITATYTRKHKGTRILTLQRTNPPPQAETTSPTFTNSKKAFAA